MLNIPDVHRRLSRGIGLTVDEQREMYNLMWVASDWAGIFAQVYEAGPLPPIRKRCETCNDEGTVDCIITTRRVLATGQVKAKSEVGKEPCPDCKGTRYAN